MLSLPPLLALRFVFALNAIGIAVWFPRIPDVKAALEVDLFTLSMCFFMLPVGTMLGFAVAGRVLRRYGAREVCRWGGPLFILSFILPALATSALTLGAALLTAGLAIASVEVAMNAKASEIERARGRRVMSGCHAFWSIGSMSGALIGGAAASLQIPFLAQQLVLAPIFAALAYVVALPLPADRRGTVEAVDPARRRLALPGGALLAVCVLPMGALLIEGAMMEWSALFLRGDVGLEPFAAGAVFAAFALAMAVSRFAGDALADRFGPGHVLAASALAAGTGMAAFALAPGLATATGAAALLGLGVANIYPLAMSRAPEVPGRGPEDNIAIVAFSAFTVFLIGPPLIGTLGSLLGLPMALLLLAPAGFYPLFMIQRGLAARPKEG